MKTPWIRPLAAAVLLSALAGGCGGAGARKDSPRAQEEALLSPRDLATVVRADLAAGVPVQGTLEPSADVNIVTPYPELVEQVLVKEGQVVRRGEVLARMRRASVEPAAASAEAQRRVAKADYERMNNLFKEGAVARRDVEAAEAQLKAAEALAATAGKKLEDATVQAPFDGVVAKRYVQGGDRVGDGDQLFRFVNTAELEFSASVPTEGLGRIRVGDPVSLDVSGLGGVAVAGRVARINATVDPATRQVKVYVSVANRDHRLAGDMFASGRILLDAVRGVPAVPSAVVRRASDGSAFAWVVAGGKLEKRAVTAGMRDEARDLVEVKSGLHAGETVVASPIEGVVPGQPVRIGGEAAPAARPAATGGGK